MMYPEVLIIKKNLQYLKGVLKPWSHSKILHLDSRPLVISAMLEFWNNACRTLNFFFLSPYIYL